MMPGWLIRLRIRASESTFDLSASPASVCPLARRRWPCSFFFSITFIAYSAPVRAWRTFLTTANVPRPSSPSITYSWCGCTAAAALLGPPCAAATNDVSCSAPCSGSGSRGGGRRSWKRKTYGGFGGAASAPAPGVRGLSSWISSPLLSSRVAPFSSSWRLTSVPFMLVFCTHTLWLAASRHSVQCAVLMRASSMCTPAFGLRPKTVFFDDSSRTPSAECGGSAISRAHGGSSDPPDAVVSSEEPASSSSS